MDDPQIPLIYGENSVNPPAFGDRYHRGVAQSQIEVGVLRDQHRASFQIVACNGFHIEGPDPYVSEKAAQGFEAEARPQQIIDLSKHGRWDEDVILLALYDSA